MSSDPLETTRSIAEAVTSVSDTARKGMELTEKAGAFFTKVLGEDAAGVLKDTLFYFRAKNAIALQDKLDRILARRKIANPRAIPLRLAIPFLDAATLEDDATLQERWARLLANAMDPGLETETQRVFGSILSRMSPLDCLVLEKMREMSLFDPKLEITPQLLAAEFSRDDKSICVAVGSLGSQGLVERKPKSRQAIGSIAAWLIRNSAFQITELGEVFLVACSDKPNGHHAADAQSV